MRYLFLVFVLAAPFAAGAQPAHGTVKEYNVAGDRLAAQIYPVSDFIMVARTATEAGKGGFPQSSAKAVASAFLQDHGMGTCKVSKVALRFATLPGVYQAFYRC